MATQEELFPSEEISLWSSLPTDILHLILSRLSWSDHPNFKLVCKNWGPVVSQFYPVWVTPLLFNSSDACSDMIRYYSPYFNANFELDRTLGIPMCDLCCARDGLLTLAQEGKITITDPISSSLREISRPDELFFSRDFNISHDNGILRATMLIGWVEIDFYDGEQWSNYEGKMQRRFCPSDSNPVFHNGLFYFLGNRGNLGVYNPSKNKFRILSKPRRFGFPCKECYLVESDGKLYSVVIGEHESFIHTFGLNEQLMEWEKIDKLEGRALFTGTLTTIMKTTFKSMENKIYLSRIYGEPETIRVRLVDSNGQLAFVPISLPAPQQKEPNGSGEVKILCHELGQENPQGFWDTEDSLFNIWIDLNSNVQ